MARTPEIDPLYTAYQDFAQLCLVEDRSLLWPDRQLWTPANITAVRHNLVDTPELSNKSFEEKLVLQMAGLSSDVWGLLADAYYLYCLIPEPRHLKVITKVAGITRFAQNGHLPIPDSQDLVWKPLGFGFCNPGQRFHQKYREFWLIFIFAEQLKKAPDRKALLEDRQKLQDLLDACLEMIPNQIDRGSDMRHAILYLAFPDFYERIVSLGDKKGIITNFKDKVLGTLSSDVDQAVYQIRQAMEKDAALPQPLDFYHPTLRVIWKNPPQSSPLNPFPATPVKVKEPAETYSIIEPVQDILRLLSFTRNVIVYGPPGTGKTYIANLVAGELVKEQLKKPLPEALQLQSTAEDNTFYDLLALGMYLAGKEKSYLVPEIMDFPIIQARFTVRPIKNKKENIWGYLQAHTGLESKTVNVVSRAEPFLFDKDSSSRWHLTSSGQEYVKQNLNELLNSLTKPSKDTSKAEDFITRVAFHQSYSYEDFIEGFRPVRANEIEIVKGKFLEVCTQAASNPDSNYVLLIDEINRGNISKIFGELITLLEDDKRAGQPASFPIELAYSHMKFQVPGNLYIIGTMNTADRSIALLDVALRRRFAFFELLPSPELLQHRIIGGEEGIQVDLEILLQNLNEGITKELSADYQIGHSYLMKVGNLAGLEFVWNSQILPLLQEYFYSWPDQLREILKPYLTGQEDERDLRREGNDLLVALSELAK